MRAAIGWAVPVSPVAPRICPTATVGIPISSNATSVTPTANLAKKRRWTLRQGNSPTGGHGSFFGHQPGRERGG